MRRINRKLERNILNKLSIIITYFNNEDYISECIHSLKSQRNQDFDIIVVDDGSTDRSTEILQKIKSYDKDAFNCKRILDTHMHEM